MVNGNVLQAKRADQFLFSLRLLAKLTDQLEGTKKVATAVLRGVRGALEMVGVESTMVNALSGMPNVEPLGETHHSVTPFRYDDYVAKFSLKPVAPGMRALARTVVDVAGREDTSRRGAQHELRQMDTGWEFQVQPCVHLEKRLVEDPMVV